MRPMHCSKRTDTRWPVALLVAGLGFTAAACSGGPNNMTSPSAIGGSQARPGVQAANDDTAVAYLNPVDLTVTIQTTTTSSDPVDGGTIHLQILVDASGNALPCDTAGGIWVRFDGQNGGMTVAGGQTTHTEDFGNIGSRNIPVGGESSETVKDVSCGQPFCIRAQYIPNSGPPPKAGQHFSDADFSPLDAPYVFDCPACTYTQGFWKTHGPSPTGGNENEWPASVLSGGMTLGTVNYTAAQLQSIFDAPVAGNGLISLAHQLIAAKLNIANGTPDAAVAAAIAAADALIGGLVIPPVGSGYLAPSATSALTGTLGSYNEGTIGPGHCESD